mgnify:CR=1 FL=1
MDAVTVLHTEIRELVRRRGVDPLTEPEVLPAAFPNLLVNGDRKSVV